MLLGVDCGASGVRAHLIEELASGRLRLGERRIEHDWTTGGFEPLPLEVQLESRDSPDRSRLEVEEGDIWIQTIANAIAELVLGLPPAALMIGVCAPGLKNADRSGTVVVANGPRIPHFTEELERALRGRNLGLARPIGPILDDGDATALGEEFAATGVLSGVESAYVLALGTGLAEGLKVNGGFVRVSDLRGWFPAPWSTGDEGRLAMPALRMEHGRCDELAVTGDSAAAERLTSWAEALADFLAERERLLVASDVSLDRIVLAARGGGLVASEALAQFVRNPLEKRFAKRRNQEVPPSFLLPSTLRAAPAIGALAAASGRLVTTTLP